MKRALSLLGPALAYVAYIFVMGSLKDVGPPMEASDKTAHFVAFGIMVPFVLRAVPLFRRDLAMARRVLVSAAVSSALGALLEIWQMMLPYRSAEVLDWLADTAGAAVAASIIAMGYVALARHEKHRRSR